MNKDLLPSNSLSAHIEYSSGERISDLITKFKIHIMYEGPNRNGSFFSREVMRKMGNTIGGVPVVGHYSKENGDFLEHGDLIVSVVNNEVNMRKEGPVPYGFVPHNADIWFEEKTDNDGVNRKYMTTYVYLWTGRYSELSILSDGQNNQSMELNPDSVAGNFQQVEGEDLFVFDNAEFSALCILGKGVEPAFEGAGVDYINYGANTTFAQKLQDMKAELNTTFSLEDKSEVENMDKDKDLKLETPETEEFVKEPESSEEPKTDPTPEIAIPGEETREIVENGEKEDEVEKNEEESAEGAEESEEEKVEENLEEREPSDEELAAIAENSEDLIDDEELNSLIDLGSNIDKIDANLAEEFAVLKEDYEKVVAELQVYQLKELRSEKRVVLNQYQDDIEASHFDELVSNMDNYSLEDLETKAQAVAYATLKTIIDASKKLEGEAVKTDYSLNGVSMNINETKTEIKKSTMPSWAAKVLDKQ